MNRDKEFPKSICVLRLSAIGDCCHAIALIQAIQTYKPESKITWVIGKIEYQLLKEILPSVEFIVFDKKQGLKEFKKLFLTLRNRKFDALLNLQANFRANLVSLCIPAKEKIGFGFARARELQWLFTNKKAVIGAGQHVAEGFMDFAAALGLPAAKPSWNIQIPEVHLTWAKTYRDERPLFVLCPAASKAERNWTVEGYSAVIRHAHQKGYKVMLVGGPSIGEKELASDIVQQAGVVDENLVGKTTLIQLLAVLQQANIVMSPDTGPAHMATIVGTPVIGLYAAQTPLRTGPYLSLNHVVSVFDEALFAETGKTAEQVSWRTRVKDKKAMLRIDETRVLNAFDKLMAELKNT